MADLNATATLGGKLDTTIVCNTLAEMYEIVNKILLAGDNITFELDEVNYTITINASGGGAVDSVNGQTGVVVLNTTDIAEGTNANYVSDAEKTVIGNTSGTNTGDQVGDGVTITGAGTPADPFVSVGGGGGDSPQTLTFTTSITPDISAGNIMTLTLTGNCTFNIPDSLTNGQLFEVRRIQNDTTPYTITWGAGFLTSGGVNFYQTGVLESVDRYTWRAISATEAELIGVAYDLTTIS